jgi:hypothetical protein
MAFKAIGFIGLGVMGEQSVEPRIVRFRVRALRAPE